MTIKEFIISRVQIFFFLVTLILTATVVLGAIYQPDKELRYYHLLSPVILAACCVLPTCATFYTKEPTPGQFIIRQIIEIALIEAVVVFLVSVPEGADAVWFRIVLGAVVIMIYLLAMVMMWLEKKLQSKKLTQQLRQFQMIHE